MKNIYDVILIGGGIMGCCTGFELSTRGLSVAIVEKSGIGEGPSGDSAAIVRQHYSNRVTAGMAHYGVKIFENFGDAVGGDCGFNQCGFVVLAPEENRAELTANLSIQREIGIDTQMISMEDVADRIPGTPFREGVIAAFESESGYVEAVPTIKAFADAAKRNGAEIFEGTEVVRIEINPNRASIVHTTSGPLRAPIIVNCAGAWGARVAALVGLELPINSCRAQVAVLDRPPDFSRHFPVVIDFTNGSFIRPYSDSSLFGGMVDPTESEAIVDADHYEKRPDPGFLQETSRRLTASWPRLKDSTSIDGYASLYAITPDWHPIIDELPGDSGFFICSGFSGHGFKLAPAVGRMTADMILDEPSPLFDRTPFNLNRFQKGSTVSGSYKYAILG